MKMNIQNILLMLLLNLLPLSAQQNYDARAASMGFSHGAAAYGLGNVGLNPAGLALKTDYDFEFTLFSLNAGIRNNSFNKEEYERYFTTGDLLTAEDIDYILNKIPDSGLRGDGFLRSSVLSFYMPNFSLALVGGGVGKLNVPKAFTELPLLGNRGDGTVYTFDDAEINGWGHIGLIVSGAIPFEMDESSAFDMIALGLSFRYLNGLFYGESVKTTGFLRDFNLQNERPFFELEGELEFLSASGGNGYSADIGLLATINKKLNIGLTFLNPLSNMSWNDNPERRLYAIRGDTLNLPSRISDSLLTSQDTTMTIDPFSTKLPLILDFALAYQATPAILLTAEYEQGLNDNMGGTKRPRIATGFEYTGIPILPLRAGINIGGTLGTSVAVGGGLDFKHWYLNFAYVSHGRVLPGDYTRSSVAITSRLRF